MLWRGPVGGGAASGKMGAMIASRARTTQYLKARVNTGRIVPTALQGVIRNAISTLVSLWQTGISSATRAGWSQYALNVSKTNRLGDLTHVAGVNWFVGNNTVRLQLGQPIVEEAPTVFNTGDIDWSGTTFAAGGTLGTLTLAASPSALALGASDSIAMWTSPAFSIGREKWYGQFRLGVTISGNDTNTTFVFALPFGSAGTDGQIAGKLRISRDDGRLSSPYTIQVSL